MKHLNLLEKKIIMQKPDSMHNYFGWPTVARLQDGRLAAVASGFRFDHVCPFGKTVISYSYDEGKTWTELMPVIDTILDDRDGGILAYGENGVIVTSFNNRLSYQKQSAGTREGTNYDYMRAYLAHASKFPELEEAAFGSTFKMSRDGGKTFGPLLRSPVTAPHGPIALADGRVIYIGNVFERSPSLLESWELKEDGSMEKLGTVPPIEGGSLPSEEPHAIELSDGRILLIIRTEHQPEHPTWQNAYELFTVYQSISEDGGRTFSVPEPLCLVTDDDPEFDACNLGAPPHLFRHSSGALLLATATRLRPLGIHILISRDEGESWEACVLTHDVPDTADLGYPATCELSDGSLYTVWYQHPTLGEPAVIYGAHWTL